MSETPFDRVWTERLMVHIQALCKGIGPRPLSLCHRGRMDFSWKTFYELCIEKNGEKNI